MGSQGRAKTKWGFDGSAHSAQKENIPLPVPERLAPEEKRDSPWGGKKKSSETPIDDSWKKRGSIKKKRSRGEEPEGHLLGGGTLVLSGSNPARLFAVRNASKRQGKRKEMLRMRGLPKTIGEQKGNRDRLSPQKKTNKI